MLKLKTNKGFLIAKKNSFYSQLLMLLKYQIDKKRFGNTSFKVFMSSSSGFMTLPLVTFMFAYMRDNEELREILSFAKTNRPSI